MYRTQEFMGPHELGRSGTVYLFIKSDGLVHCNVPMWCTVGLSLRDRSGSSSGRSHSARIIWYTVHPSDMFCESSILSSVYPECSMQLACSVHPGLYSTTIDWHMDLWGPTNLKHLVQCNVPLCNRNITFKMSPRMFNLVDNWHSYDNIWVDLLFWLTF